MMIKRCLMAFCTAIAVYSVSSIIFGNSGILAMEKLSSERDRLVQNMEQLKHINQELGGSVEALSYDTDTLALYARNLGYGEADERFIRIVGLPVHTRKTIQVGSLIIPVEYKGIPDFYLKLVAAFFGLAVLITLFMVGKKYRNITG